MIKSFSAALILILASTSNVFADSKVVESKKVEKTTTPDVNGNNVEVTTEKTTETEVEETK